MSGMTAWEIDEPPWINRPRSFEKKVVHFDSCVGRGGAGVPNRLFWRGLFERSEFLSHLIRDGGGGTRRTAHGQKWFWFLLPKQKEFVCRGETLHSKFRRKTQFGNG